MRRILFGSISIGIAIIIAVFIFKNNFRSPPTEAIYPPVIDLAGDSSRSVVDEKTTTTQFFITGDSGYLYKSAQDEEGAAIDFISKDPEVIDTDVKGESTFSTQKVKKKLFPKSIAKNIALVRKKTDADGSKHLYFSQKLGNTPVFGSVLSVHMRNKGEIYAVIGSLVLQDAVTPSILSLQQAEDIARAKASEEFDSPTALQVVSSVRSIYNSGLIDGFDNASNLPVQEVTIADSLQLPTYGEKFMVSLVDGAILYRAPIIHTAIDRKIFDCDGGLSTCPLVRSEGSAVSNRRDPDLMYSQLGDAYSFFRNSFQRDSFDNAGAQLVAFVNVTDAKVGCPNAAWLGGPYQRLVFCPNMVANDVVAHEFTHAVVESTANLMLYKQSGALNEAVADIFSFGVDNDWTIGEDTGRGILRNAENPPGDPAGTGGPHPDRLFSPYYTCSSNDQGGIHANMTIITKTFYLMSQGGAFNGCSISPIGKDAAHKIWYRALTTYLSTTSNFGYAYLSAAQACTDLYGSSSNTCAQTVRAFQATEVDQQPTNTQEGARCLNLASRKPLCANTPTATSTPAPTTTTCALKASGDANCNNIIDLIDFEIWRKEATKTIFTLNADFNKNGTVDITDFEIWRKGKFGQ